MNKRYTFQIGKFEYTGGQEFYGKGLKAFIFVDVSEFEPEMPASDAGEKAWRTWTKAVVALKKQALIDAGIDADKYEYSRTAGCKCGCSPGFTSKEEFCITMFGKATPYKILWITAKK